MIELPRSSDEERRLAMLRSLGVAAARDPSLNSLAKLAADLADAPVGLVCLIESETILVVGAHGFEGDRINRWDSFCGHALIRPTETLWVPDARTDHRFLNSRYVVGEPRTRFYAGNPLLVNGCMVGTLCVLSQEPKAHDEILSRRLRGVADACQAELAERHRTHAVRSALTASADALIDCDADGRIQSWSEGAEALFGFSREEALGAEITLIIPPEHREGHRAGMGRWRSSGAARLGRRLELPAIRKDGSSLDIELWMSVSHDNQDARVHANIRDISERRAQARALSEAMDRAEAANRAKTAFLANMSHELRTPLNGVTACSGMLAASPLTPEQRRLNDIIAGAADQLTGLIADLLDLARIESGELSLSPSPTDLGDLIDGLGELFRLRAEEKGIALTLEIAEDARQTVMVDAGRLKQVLVNLLTNAIKFTEAGEVVLRVSRSGAGLRFEVEDTGIGFGPEQQAAIFDRFQQADPTITRRFGGTGLGLAISRDLVVAMGGVMDCRSMPGRGSAFWLDLDLPVVEGARPIVPDQEEPQGGLEGLHILVVDDNATNRQVAGLILGAAGVEVTFAETGREALSALSCAAFDLVLMDMMMPEMDGVEATRRLRAGEVGHQAARTPVVMLTANTLPQHIAQTLDAGADGHLAKPITPGSLLESIVSTLSTPNARWAERSADVA